MAWRWAGWSAGIVVLMLSGLVLLQVSVPGAGTPPRAPLFVSVSRPAAVLAGLVLLVPAIVLIVVGRGASVPASYLTQHQQEGPRETP